MRKHKTLRTASLLLKVTSVVVAIAGAGFSVLFLFQTDQDYLDKVITSVGILVSIGSGILLYAVDELFTCIMDIEANTREGSNSSSSSK